MTEYLENLWYAKALQETKDPRHADRVRVAFQKNKHKKPHDKCNEFTDQTFSDDGRTIQGYHTPTSIKAELQEAGLTLVDDYPQPIFYPWELCRRFDYGYFSNAEQLLQTIDPKSKFWDPKAQLYGEIWDWYVRAR